MDTRFYQAQGIDIQRIATELERAFVMQGYQVQHFGNSEHITVQMKKGGDFAAIIGMQTALTLTMQRSQGGVLAMTGQQKWVDKAVVGAVSLIILWPLAITAGAGAIQQAQLASQVLSLLDGLVHQQIPHVQIGPIPLDMMPQYQQPNAPAGYGAPPPPFPSQNQQSSAPAGYGAPPPPPPLPSQNQQPSAPTVYAAPPPPPPFSSQNRQSSASTAYGAPPPPLPSQKLICANCQARNDEDGKYCMSCGQALVPQEPQKALCPKCGAQTKPNATFCTQCGTSLVQTHNRA